MMTRRATTDQRGEIFAFLGADTVGVKAGLTREVADE
jgi:hypothetical protein